MSSANPLPAQAAKDAMAAGTTLNDSWMCLVESQAAPLAA